MRAPILVSIPHGGWQVPDEVGDIWALSTRDAFFDGDPFTSKIYDHSDRVAFQLVMQYYRAAIDLNRRPDDVAPENPDGAIKSLTCWNVSVYKQGTLPDGTLKRTLLEKYYFPYHRELDEQIRNPEIRLAVDCHTMAAKAPPIQADAGAVRPLICLGNLGDEEGEMGTDSDRVSCDPELIRFMAGEFRAAFQHEDLEIEPPATATMNVPFSGGYITRTYSGRGVPLVQIEMSRALYLTEQYFDKVNLQVKESRIKDLNQKVWKVLSNTVMNL